MSTLHDAGSQTEQIYLHSETDLSCMHETTWADSESKRAFSTEILHSLLIPLKGPFAATTFTLVTETVTQWSKGKKSFLLHSVSLIRPTDMWA